MPTDPRPAKSNPVQTHGPRTERRLQAACAAISIFLLTACPSSSTAWETLPPRWNTPRLHGTETVTPPLRLAKEPADPAKKFRWLFKDRASDETPKEPDTSTLLEKLDQEVKEARKLYLSGDTENAILKYRSAVDRLESLVDDIPPGNPLLKEMEQRLQIYDELATKLLGPIQGDPKEELAGNLFHLMEKRRLCRRNLTLKKAGLIKFYDVANSLLGEEADILMRLLELREEVHTAENRQAEESLKTMLADVRRSLLKSSARYALFRRGMPTTLAEVRRDLLGKDAAILDFNLLSDRMVVGVISAEKGVYYQFPANRSDIDKTVFHLQDQLREFAVGGRASFMGHAWKEPCRRIYRMLLGQLPALPKEKTTFFVIPDRSLWYLPFSAILDPEDRPFGQDHMVAVIPSVDMLRFVRSGLQKKMPVDFTGDLLLFESIPWISEEQLQDKTQIEASGKQSQAKTSEGEKIEKLVLSNPVYPKPSEITVAIQKIFKKSHVWVGPTATSERLREDHGLAEEVTILAVPLSMTDAVEPDRQPSFFFSPDKRGHRRLEARDLFSIPIGSRILLLPISWFEIRDREAPLGEGPLLVASAMFYAGVKMGMVNYSDPNWGADEPFIIGFLKNVAAKKPAGDALSGHAGDVPAAGLDSSFDGKPPAWAGWIPVGDPG